MAEGGSLDFKKCLGVALAVAEETAKSYGVIQKVFSGKSNMLSYQIIAEEKKHAGMIQNVMKQSNL